MSRLKHNLHFTKIIEIESFKGKGIVLVPGCISFFNPASTKQSFFHGGRCNGHFLKHNNHLHFNTSHGPWLYVQCYINTWNDTKIEEEKWKIGSLWLSTFKICVGNKCKNLRQRDTIWQHLLLINIKKTSV